MSRLAMDVVDSGLDLSKDPKFTEAVAHKVYYGPVYFRRESEPYMTLSLAGTRKDAGVSIAEVNLKLIWDVVSQIKVGEHGHAYVVGAQGRLIAHPDISLVLRNTDMSKLVQVQAAQAGNAGADLESLQGAKNIQGQEVLTASAPIAPLGWTMFVELPVEEAYASLYLALQRLAIVLAGGVDLRGAGRDLPGPPHGRPDPGAARGRRAHRQRRFRPAHLDQDRRRTRRPRQPVQRHGRAPAGILCRPGKQGRAAHRGAERNRCSSRPRPRKCLQVISRSSADTESRVPDDPIERNRICDCSVRASLCVLRRLHAGARRFASAVDLANPASRSRSTDIRGRSPIDPLAAGDAVQQTVQFVDCSGNPAAPTDDRQFRADCRLSNSVVPSRRCCVPMLKEQLVGAIAIFRQTVRASPKSRSIW